MNGEKEYQDKRVLGLLRIALEERQVYAERILKIYEAIMGRGMSRSDFNYWKSRANCSGTLAYTIDKVEKFREIAREIGSESFTQVPAQEDSFPGYISPRVAHLFIINNAREIREPSPGDIIAFWERRGLLSSGVYIGDLFQAQAKKRLMFYKDGQDGDFLFEDIDTYAAQSDVDSFSCHRVE